MKKILIAVICVALVICVFGACKTNTGKSDAPETLTTKEVLETKENTTKEAESTTSVSETEAVTERSTEESTSDDYDIASAVLDGLAEKYAKPVPKNPDGSDYKIPDNLLGTVTPYTTEEIKNLDLSILKGKSLKEAFDSEIIQKIFAGALVSEENAEMQFAYIDENTFGIVYKSNTRYSGTEYDDYVQSVKKTVGSTAMPIDFSLCGLVEILTPDSLTVIYESRDVDNNIVVNFSCTETAE